MLAAHHGFHDRRECQQLKRRELGRSRMPTFEELVPQLGFLTDRHIRVAIEAGHLIERGTGTPNQLRHASYTLRLGGEIKVARARNASASTTKEFVVKHVTENDRILQLYPGDTALLYCIERLRLPDSVLGFTVARGLLFAEALAPENTYVDPGFTGSIYTTVTNISDRTVQLEYGMSIARIFFYRLCEPVQDGYRTGAAMGIAQQLQSVHLNPARTADECRRATDAQLLEAMGMIPLGGLHAVESVRRLRARVRQSQRMFAVGALAWPPLLLVANSSEWVHSNIGGLVANILAGLVTAGLIYFAPKILRFFSSEDEK
jgi:deoxycytidine triphosphate deaminase